MLATPNPLPAEQAESVSSDKRGHQQLGGRTTWWSALAKLAAKLLSVSQTAAKADFVAPNCLRTVPTDQIRHPKGSKRVLRGERSCCCNFRKRNVFADLCKDFRQTPSSAASRRQIRPSDAAESSPVFADSKQRENKPDKASTATQCMVLDIVSATNAASQQLRLDYITTKPPRQPGASRAPRLHSVSRLLEPERLAWKVFQLHHLSNAPHTRALAYGATILFSTVSISCLQLPARLAGYVTAFKALQPHRLLTTNAMPVEDVLNEPIFFNRQISVPLGSSATSSSATAQLPDPSHPMISPSCWQQASPRWHICKWL